MSDIIEITVHSACSDYHLELPVSVHTLDQIADTLNLTEKQLIENAIQIPKKYGKNRVVARIKRILDYYYFHLPNLSKDGTETVIRFPIDQQFTANLLFSIFFGLKLLDLQRYQSIGGL